MTHMSFYNFQTVRESVHSQIDSLVTTLYPSARRQGSSYRVGNEQGEKGSSFSISTRPNNAGSYIDHANPETRGDAIALVALARGLSYEEAGRWLATFLGVPPEERIHIRKVRKEPLIKRDEIKKLNAKSIAYAESRGIHQQTLERLRCASSHDAIVFPHFDEETNLVMVKYWSCDGQKKIWTNENPVPVLFGKTAVDPVTSGGSLVICEGHWDALTWLQLGVPAVSIPSGVSNDEWIAEDWNFLNRFSEILLDFDDDPPGREAEQRVVARLGYERCRMVRYRHKDANDALRAGDSEMLLSALREAREAPIDNIVNSQDLRRPVRDTLNRTNVRRGTPFFLPGMRFEFRPHETTLWFGHTSHGKSTILSQQIAYAASQGKVCFVASFEQRTDITLANMLVQYTSDPDIGSSPHFDEAFDELSSRVLFFNSMQRCNPQQLIATMTLAHKQLGVEEFVIDNAMTLDVDRQDNTAQAAVCDMFRVFASRIPAHVHLVAHPRKAHDGVVKPPSVSEIRGASEWGDMSHNVMVVYRDVGKAERIETMKDEGISMPEIRAFDESMADGKLLVRKQRLTGELPIASYRFDRLTKRAWKSEEDMLPYFQGTSVGA
jgi:twinkle protein